MLLDSLCHASGTGESGLDGCEALVDEQDQRLQDGPAHNLAIVGEFERHAAARRAPWGSERQRAWVAVQSQGFERGVRVGCNEEWEIVRGRSCVEDLDAQL